MPLGLAETGAAAMKRGGKRAQYIFGRKALIPVRWKEKEARCQHHSIGPNVGTWKASLER